MNGCRGCDCRRFEYRDVMIGGAAFAAATTTGVLAGEAKRMQGLLKDMLPAGRIQDVAQGSVTWVFALKK